MTATELQNAWLNAAPGSKIVPLDADIGRVTLKKSKRPKGAPKVEINLNGKNITREPEVGSSDTLLLKSGLRDLIVHFNGATLLACSRAGIKTEGPGGARGVWLNGPVAIDGGWNAYENDKPLPNKWLAHHYLTGGWTETGLTYVGCADEHARYFHNIAGNHYFGSTLVQWCGRTALQIVNRMKEVDDDMPEGYGDVVIEDETVIDACLEQGGGGSAYTFRGGMKDSSITMNRVNVRLGCDPALNKALHGRATGALVMDSSPESAPGAGDMAWPGGTNELRCTDCDFEVGTVYPGTGSAKRPNVKVGAVKLFTWKGGRIKVPAGEVALEIQKSCDTFLWSGSPVIEGKVVYKGERFNSWDEFTDAHEECAA